MEPDREALRRIRDVLKAANAPDGARDLFDGRAAFLVPIRAGEADLEGSVLDHFTSAFDALELAILVCRSDTIRSRWMVPDRIDAERHLLGEIALLDLFQAGILVASEVLTLLRTGFSTGALARWRALHETTTKAEFISAAGGERLIETAERYLRYEEFREIHSLELWKGLERKLTGDEARVGDVITEMAKERRAAIATTARGSGPSTAGPTINSSLTPPTIGIGASPPDPRMVLGLRILRAWSGDMTRIHPRCIGAISMRLLTLLSTAPRGLT